MAFDNRLRRGYVVVCGLLIFFSVIELAISAWLTARFDARQDYFSIAERDRTHFILFASIWTSVIFTMFVLLSFRMESSPVHNIVSHVSFLLLTWVFWTAGAASITTTLGGGLNCSQTVFAYCGQLNAMEAFSWLIWVLVTFATITVLIRAVTATQHGYGLKASFLP